MKEVPKGHWVEETKLKEGATIVDAGACWGDFTKGMEELGKFKIWMIEPAGIFQELLKRDATIIRAALVGDNYLDNKLMFWFFPNSLERSNGKELYSGGQEPQKVDVIRWSDLVKKVGGHIDYLKMDIEGFEWEVVQSMKDNKEVDQISMEIHTNKEEIIKRLSELGYATEMKDHAELYAYTLGDKKPSEQPIVPENDGGTP